MLQFVLGAAGTGKSTYLLNAIKERAQRGEASVLLVPEQFSWEAESSLYSTLGPALSARAEVFSFTSLAREVERHKGGGTLPVLSDAGRSVFLRRALKIIEPELKSYTGKNARGAFFAMCASAIKEFKSAGISHTQLYEIAVAGGEEHEKLAELALIYGEYEALVSERYTDQSDRVTRAAAAINFDFFAGKAVFIDAFEGFTYPQYEMLKNILPARAGCTVALLTDTLVDKSGGYGLFSETQGTAARLLAMAQQLDVPLAPSITLDASKRFQSPALHALDGFLRTSVCAGAAGEGAFFTKFEDPWQEVRTATAEIRRLVAEEGAHYHEMAVICRDLGAYRAPLRASGRHFDVPFFIDENKNAEFSAPAVFTRAALSIAHRGLNTQDILTLLKTELTRYTAHEIAQLENYLFTWQITYASSWQQPFERSASGFDREDILAKETLEIAERLRGELVALLSAFAAKIKGASGEETAREIYLLLCTFGAPESLEGTASALDAAGQGFAAQEMRRMWNITAQQLDEMARLLASDEVSPQEFSDLFTMFVRAQAVGETPQGLETVLVTTAERMRLSVPKYVFVLGLTQGIFPRLEEARGLITGQDRELLAENGIEMPGAYLQLASQENLYFYKALTVASKTLYMSFTSTAGGGEPTAAPATFAKKAGVGALKLGAQYYAGTPAAALQELAANYNENTPHRAALESALSETEAENALAQMRYAAQPAPAFLQETDALHSILGREISISPTRVDSFYNCNFAYYLNYVLRLNTRKKAELSPLQSGNFMHHVLEKVMSKYGADFANASDAEITASTGEIADEYVRDVMQGADAESARLKYTIKRLKTVTAELLCQIAAEQRQGLFRPVAFELDISDGGDVEPLRVQTAHGQTVKIVGKVDRLDMMEKDGEKYIRVIDYKTGSKEFSLNDVYYGLNIQMLLYLFTIVKNGTGALQGALPAGVLYLKGDQAVKKGEHDTKEEKVYKVDGLILDDPAVRAGMDDGTGLFMPFSAGAKATTKAKCFATLERLGRIEQHIENLVLQMASELYAGAAAASPLKNGESLPCEYCDYKTVCRKIDGQNERATEKGMGAFAAPQSGDEEEEAGDGTA